MKIKLNTLERFDKNEFLEIAVKIGVGSVTEYTRKTICTHIASQMSLRSLSSLRNTN